MPRRTRRPARRTLVVRLGTSAGKLEYGLLLVAAFATPLIIWGRGLASPWVLLPC